MTLGFIRYFATTDDSAVGRAALSYLVSLLRIAPVRVVSKSGQLDGAWRRYEALIMTPMAGECVSCVCTPPAQWIWEAAVPMPTANLGAQGAATAPSAPSIAGTARRVQELYTPKLRNVLFVVEPPKTDAQRQTAARYEAVVCAYAHDRLTMPNNRDYNPGTLIAYVPCPVIDHRRIREAVLGDPAPSETPYR